MACSSQNPGKFNDYEGFVAKFKPKKTTDDCYTPAAVYEAVRSWVDRNICPLDGVEILRPFYPGGDYEAEEYPEGCVVLDNPPFSIFMKICRTLHSRGVRFFLFAPAMTCIKKEPWLTAVISDAGIVYENGADVPTCFVTNIPGGDPKVIVAGDLSKELERVQREGKTDRSPAAVVPPPNVTNAARLRKIAARGVSLTIAAADCMVKPSLDIPRREKTPSLFGNSLLLSEKAAAEKAAAEKAAAEKAAERRKFFIRLSDDELAAIASLG